jgi:hypothetical protein
VDPGYENPDFKFKDKVKYHSVILTTTSLEALKVKYFRYTYGCMTVRVTINGMKITYSCRGDKINTDD